MFKISLLFIVTFLVAVFQIAVLPVFFPSQMVPNLALVSIVVWISIMSFNKAFLRLMLLGIFTDIFGLYFFGLNILVFTVVAYLLNSLVKRFLVAHRTWGFLITLVLVIVASLAYETLWGMTFLLLDKFKILENSLAPIFASQVIYRTIGNLAIFILIYFPLLRLERALSLYDKVNFKSRFFERS